MPTTRRIAMTSVDKAWLEMDSPVNLMIINGVMLFDEVIDFEHFSQVIQRRLVERFDRFQQRVIESPAGTGRLYWEDDPYFDLRSHLRHVALPEPGDIATLQTLISGLMSEPFETNRPLWRFYLVHNVDGGCAVYGRIHHCIADGIALVQVLLSLTDVDPDAGTEASGKGGVQSRPKQSLSPLGFGRQLIRQTTGGMVSAARSALHLGIQSVEDPTYLFKVAYSAGMMTSASAAILAKLALIPADSDSVFKGKLGAHKRVIWSDPIDLQEVKAVCKLAGATVNDLLVTAVVGALRRYMLLHGEVVDVRAMVPVNLRDARHELTLGNQFALVYLNLPVSMESAMMRLRSVKKQMDIMKGSPEPMVVYQLLNVIGRIPGELADWATTWFSTKASAVLTNVPGPRQLLYFAGKPMRRILFWVPQSGRIGLGISIISYNGAVTLGLMVDDGLVENPELIMNAFHAEIDLIAAEVQSQGGSSVTA